MRKRSKLEKIYPIYASIQSKLARIERDLISSHQQEQLYEESLAVAKIKSDPNNVHNELNVWYKNSDQFLKKILISLS